MRILDDQTIDALRTIDDPAAALELLIEREDTVIKALA